MTLADQELESGHHDAAVEHLMRASELGHPRAKYNIGIIAAQQGDNNLAYLMLVSAVQADAAYLTPLVELARMYTEGRGVGVDPPKGLAMMRFVADHASEARLAGIANYNAGMLFKEGSGLPRSPERAREHLERALALGFEPAQAALAALSPKRSTRKAPRAPDWSPGVFERTHTIAMVDGDRWVETKGRDCLELRAASDGSLTASFFFQFDNDHGCGLRGPAAVSADGKLVVTSNEFGPCELTFEQTDDDVRIIAASPTACTGDPCGARGFLVGQSLPRAARKMKGACSVAE